MKTLTPCLLHCPLHIHSLLSHLRSSLSFLLSAGCSVTKLLADRGAHFENKASSCCRCPSITLCFSLVPRSWPRATWRSRRWLALDQRGCGNPPHDRQVTEPKRALAKNKLAALQAVDLQRRRGRGLQNGESHQFPPAVFLRKCVKKLQEDKSNSLCCFNSPLPTNSERTTQNRPPKKLYPLDGPAPNHRRPLHLARP